MEQPTAEEVRLIVSGAESVNDSIIGALVTTATRIAEGCPGIVSASADLQKEIIKWIAAHYLSIAHLRRAGPVAERTLGDASESYTNPTMAGGKGLNATFYGQQAITLDRTGCLESLGKMKATFKVL